MKIIRAQFWKVLFVSVFILNQISANVFAAELLTNPTSTTPVKSYTGETSSVPASGSSFSDPNKALSAPSQLPPVPAGWARAASNANFAFQVRPDASGLNNYLYLKDLREANAANEYLVGGGSIARHNPVRYDVSTDGKYVVAAYRDSGGQVGQLSNIAIHHTSDLKAGIQNPVHNIQPANAVSITFMSDSIAIIADVRKTVNGVETIRRETIIVKYSDINVPYGWTRTKSNPNYAYQIRTDAFGNRNVYVKDLIDLNGSNEYLVGGGSAVRHNPVLVDVSPEGKHILVAYRESGPVVGNLSEISFYQMSAIKTGTRTPVYTISTANIVAAEFSGQKVTVSAYMRGPNYALNGQTVFRSFDISLAGPVPVLTAEALWSPSGVLESYTQYSYVNGSVHGTITLYKNRYSNGVPALIETYNYVNGVLITSSGEERNSGGTTTAFTTYWWSGNVKVSAVRHEYVNGVLAWGISYTFSTNGAYSAYVYSFRNGVATPAAYYAYYPDGRLQVAYSWSPIYGWQLVFYQ